MTSTQTPFDRSTAVSAVKADDFDVLVIGAGITGAGVALDAASRGLKTLLLEREDFASGTSSKSSKMVHGGLRYLQQGEIRLVYEALAERQRLQHNAPNLVHELPFLIPILNRGGVMPKRIARLLGIAMWQYDLTGGWRLGKMHKRLSKEKALELMPTLRKDQLSSAYLYYDAGGDDARITLSIARTAVIKHGATALNHAGVTEIIHDSNGKATGVVAKIDGEQIQINAKVLVNATGVWSDETRTMDEGSDPDTIRPAKGVHCTVPWDLVRNETAVVLPVPGDKRSVFVVPWGDITFIGTTDTDYEGSVDEPRCTTEEIEYLLSAVNKATDSELGPEHVIGTWAGLRPLVKNASSGRTADLSRGHKVNVSDSGMVNINGGKLTTYRHMAADTVNAVMKRLDRKASCRTKKLRFIGTTTDKAPTDKAALHLHGRYGTEASDILALVAEDETLGELLAEGQEYLKAEAIFAIRNEMACTISDVLDRRTRIRIWNHTAAVEAAPDVARMLANELNWSDELRESELAAYLDELAAELKTGGFGSEETAQ